MRRLPSQHQEILAFLSSLGFGHVQYYDVSEEGVYYDAVSPTGIRCEVRLKLETTNEVDWRALGVKRLEDVEWFSLGPFEPVQPTTEPPKPKPDKKDEVEYKEDDTGQLSLF